MMDEANAAGTESACLVEARAGDATDHSSNTPPDEMARMGEEIIAALKTVYDPEIPADLYELGLIYKIAIDDDRLVSIEMTLTSPNCPSAAELPGQVRNAVKAVSGVHDAKVAIVWEPTWDPSRMSDEARTVLNMW
ncbi:hypothetical protein NB311A_02144 [Nitrobacter sp. Nb-311A]|uniref:DUF59 domain-containing protein n=1 Tax=unclassified Nitrobacter TaxID=2620411 RepID=UPI0000687F9C|nr:MULTISPECIES: DUF59 domain-containing protein [unclassified Nitrobacter]EAQ36267.1 hypothetical protein NB311A_02144 [Nitrobacter sp. Nb-311A]MCV0387326.1 DUF59 domain-containing protein [Nitrobacter sp.]